MGKIWIVEDDRTIREAIEVILNKDGHIARAFRSAEDALQGVETDPDLLITDYKLPGINGIELIKKLKARTPSYGINSNYCFWKH